MAEKSSQSQKPIDFKISDETRQHFRAAREEFHKSIEGMLPPGFSEHHRKAHKEMLLAWRSLIDTSLEHLEEKKSKV